MRFIRYMRTILYKQVLVHFNKKKAKKGGVIEMKNLRTEPMES